LSSVRAVIITASAEVLWMLSVKSNTPPGSARVSGVTDLVRSTVGSTSVTVTVLLSESSRVVLVVLDVTEAVFG